MLQVTGCHSDPHPVVSLNASRPKFSIKSLFDFTEAALYHCWSDWLTNGHEILTNLKIKKTNKKTWFIMAAKKDTDTDKFL